MPISRKEFLRESAILGLLAVLPKEFKFNDWDKGLDGKTVWEARGMSVSIKALGTDNTVYKIYLNGVDFQVFKPFLGKIEMVMREEDSDNFSGMVKKVRAQEVFGVMPTVTGFSGKYIADLGYIFDNGRKWDYYAEPFQEGNVLATYLAIDRYYDNKIVNATTAVWALAETMSGKPIASGEEFSYLEAAKIKDLESTKEGNILIGKGLKAGKEGKPELVRMFGGGICVSVATIAKMARQAEAKGLVKITQKKPHGKDSSWWYFMNPDDPTKPQIDATAAFPGVDFKFNNLTDKPLYIIPKVQIIPDPLKPEMYDGLEHSTAFFVLSTSLRTKPVAKEEVLRIKSQLQEFRRIRGI